jgi:hypothetical protein
MFRHYIDYTKYTTKANSDEAEMYANVMDFECDEEYSDEAVFDDEFEDLTAFGDHHLLPATKKYMKTCVDIDTTVRVHTENDRHVLPTTATDDGPEAPRPRRQITPEQERLKRTMFRASCDRSFVESIEQKDLILQETTESDHNRYINSHPDVELYIHHEDVYAFKEFPRIYDHNVELIGTVRVDKLIYPISFTVDPATVSARIAPKYNKDQFTDVYINPLSDIVHRRIAPNAPFIISSKVGSRYMVYTQTYDLQKDYEPNRNWKCIGWINDNVSLSSRPSSTRTTRNRNVTNIYEYLYSNYNAQNGGVNTQHTPQEVLEIMYKHAIFPPVCRTILMKKCDTDHEYNVLKYDTNFQPVRLMIENSSTDNVRSVHSSLQEYLRGTTEAFDSLRGCGGTRDKNGNGVVKSILESVTTAPGAFIVGVERLSMFTNSNDAVENTPICTSESTELFGKRYRLVSVAAKTGSMNHGHWISYVNTPYGWYLINDNVTSRVDNIRSVRNGVLFIYQMEHYPLYNIEQGIENDGQQCWANTFSQIMRYSSYVGESIGVLDRLPTFKELLTLIDPKQQLHV